MSMSKRLRNLWLAYLKLWHRHTCSVCGLPRVIRRDHFSCVVYQAEAIRRDEVERRERRERLERWRAEDRDRA